VKTNEPSRPAQYFLRDFPAIVRFIGLLIIIAETIASLVGVEASATVLAAAGGMLVAPNIAQAQKVRNESREME
jgi:hypothetical protein